MTVFDLVARAKAYDDRPIELVDALTGWGDEYVAIDVPLRMGLRPDKAFCAPAVAATRSLDLRQLQGVFHLGAAAGNAWIAVHALGDAPDSREFHLLDRKQLEKDPSRWDRKRIEYQGAWSVVYEGSYLDTVLQDGFPKKGTDGIWLSAADPDALRPVSKLRAEREASTGTPPTVRARGRIYTRHGRYGHLGAARYAIVAEQLDLM